ncbi:MAG: STY0301 family protein [Bdellovibrionota bacterium]
MNKVFFLAAILFSQFAFSATSIVCPLKKNKIYDGDPKQEADLAPDNADSNLPHRWTLKDLTPVLVCKYGKKNKPLFTKAIVGKFTRCVTAETKTGSGIFNSINCQ